KCQKSSPTSDATSLKMGAARGPSSPRRRKARAPRPRQRRRPAAPQPHFDARRHPAIASGISASMIHLLQLLFELLNLREQGGLAEGRRIDPGLARILEGFRPVPLLLISSREPKHAGRRLFVLLRNRFEQ